MNPLQNTAQFNLTGHPALTTNIGFADGLPVGLMIVGKHFQDATLLRVAHTYEQLIDGRQV